MRCAISASPSSPPPTETLSQGSLAHVTIAATMFKTSVDLTKPADEQRSKVLRLRRRPPQRTKSVKQQQRHRQKQQQQHQQQQQQRVAPDSSKTKGASRTMPPSVMPDSPGRRGGALRRGATNGGARFGHYAPSRHILALAADAAATTPSSASATTRDGYRTTGAEGAYQATGGAPAAPAAPAALPAASPARGGPDWLRQSQGPGGAEGGAGNNAVPGYLHRYVEGRQGTR